MADLNTEIKIGADASGVEAGVTKAKRSLKDLGAAAQQAGKDAGAGMASVGAGGDQAAKKVDSATRSMQNSLQRLIAEQKAGGKASREYYEALADTKGISRGAIKPLLDQLDAAKAKTLSAESAAKSWKSSITSIGPAIAAAFSVAAITGVVGKVVAVQREFDILNSSLKTVTGSSAAAERELAWLKTFAKETPFGLSQATQGFVKMKALGLDPTRAALTSFGNTASAMGKDLNQMIEAVADASTGEFERLKEFGIKAKKQGDDVSLTFQGVTKTIGNSAKEITKYLQDIGDNQFAGAMEERAKTLDGTISALGDTWDELFRTVSTNNVGGLIFDSVTLANGALEDATTILRAMGGAAGEAGKDLGILSAIQGGIATVFETVSVLGVNLKFVLVGIGTEVKGLAQQVVEASKFNFSGVAAIRAQMVADSKAARSEIDATTARILNARKEQERYLSFATRNASAATDPRRLDLQTSSAATPTRPAGGGSSAKEQISEYARLIQSIKAKTAATEAEFEGGKKLNDAEKLRVELLGKIDSGLLKLTATEKQNVLSAVQAYDVRLKDTEAAKEALALAIQRQQVRAKEYEGIEAYMRAQTDAQVATVKAANDAVTAAQFEFDTYGKSKSQLAELTLARLQDKLAGVNAGTEIAKSIEAQIDAQKRLIGILSQGEARDAGEKAAKAAADEWQKTADSIESSLTDALLRGFESGKGFAKNLRDTLVNMFKTLVLRPIISAVVNPVAGALTGALGFAGQASAATGGGGLGGLSTLSSLSNIGSAIGGGISQTIANILPGAISSSLGLSSSALIASNAALAGGGASAAAAASAAGAAGNASLAGLFDPTGIGGIIAGIGLAASILGGKGDTRYGSQYAYTAGGDTRIVGGPNKGVDYAGQSTAQDAVISGINSLLTRVGSSSQLANFSSGFESSEKGKGFSYAGGMFSNGTQFGQGIEGLGYQNNRGSKTPDQAIAEFGDELTQATLQALQAATDIPKNIADKLQGVNIDALTGDALKNFAASIDKQITDVENFRNAVQGLPFAQLRDLSFDAAAAMLAAGGGLEALSANLGAYYDNFYSEEEKRAQTIASINAATAGSGLDAATATRESFRSLVEAQDLTTDAGRKTYASLIGVAGAFAGILPAADIAASAVAGISDTLRNLRSESETLAVSLMRAQGNTTGADAAQYQIDTAGLSAAEKAVFDYNAGIKTHIEVLNAASERTKAVESERLGLQDQLNALTMTGTQLMALQRDALDESNRALFDSVEAAKAQQAETQRLAEVASQRGQLEIQRLAEVASQRGQLEIQIMQLRNDAAGALNAQRALEIAALDATLVPLQTLINNIQDFEAAAAAAAASANQAASNYFNSVDRAQNVTDLQGQGVSVLDQIYGATETAAQSAIATANTASNAAKATADNWRRAADSIRSTLESIRSKTLEMRPDGKDALFARFQATTVLARGGDSDSAGKLSEQANSYLSIAESQATSMVQVLRERAKIESSLDDTLKIAEAGVSVQDSIAAATAATAAGIERANVTFTGFAGILQTVLSANYSGASRGQAEQVSGALATIAADVANYFKTTTEGQTQDYFGGTLKRLAGDNVQFTDAAGQVSFARATDSILDISKRIAGIGQGWQEQYGLKLPGFAVGTNYVPRDMIAQIHQGEAIIPRAYNPAANPGMGMSGGMSTARLEALVEALTKKVEELTTVQTKTLGSSEEITLILKRVTQGRPYFATKEAA